MEKTFLDSWGLTLVIFLPLVGAAVLAFLPKADEAAQNTVALIFSVATFIVSLAVMARYLDVRNQLADGQHALEVNRSWIPVIGSRYHIFMDGISLPLLVLSTLIVVLCIVYSWDHFPEPKNPKAFLMMIMVLATGMNGSFIAQDLILFFVFFELVLLPMYFMIGIWGGDNRKYASIKFFLYTLFGSALMIVAFLAIYFKSPVVTAESAQAFGLGADAVGMRSFDIEYLANWAGAGLSSTLAATIFGGLFIGFAVKVPMFPFHTWLPDAHTEAPTVGSVILAAVLLKLGTYGFIRIALPILPEAAVDWAPIIGGLAVVGIIYGALCSLVQTDMKRVIAFSSVAHMGFTMLAIATLTDFGLNAAIFGMVSHGLITGMLFFLAGSVHERYHTREIRRLGGILQQAPRMGWIFGFCCMASLGLPGLAGFWGEFPALLSAYNPAEGLNEGLFRTYMVIAAIGTVLAAAYLLWMYQRTAFGEPTEEFKSAHVHDVHTPEWIAWTPLLALIVVLGVVPSLLFGLTDRSVQTVIDGKFAPAAVVESASEGE